MQHRVYLLLYCQIAATFLVALLWLMLGERNSGYSVLCGGIAWILPSWYGIKRFFKNISPPNFKQNTFHFVQNFYFSEIGKILLSSVLLILFISQCQFLKIPAFFSGYIVSISCIFLQPLWLTEKKNQNI
jgi:F0F1-type ATP synthase assembly protein I